MTQTNLQAKAILVVAKAESQAAFTNRPEDCLELIEAWEATFEVDDEGKVAKPEIEVEQGVYISDLRTYFTCGTVYFTETWKAKIREALTPEWA